ncbi:MAG: polysaccharide deacetylase family protein [Cytophagales bacterium]|jgi:peptidoglycan/xylan/chitin deacetylase (PgdA/CDA1 family)
MNKILFKFLRVTGIPYIVREIYQKDKVTILLFHDIKPKSARKAFAYLSKHYNIISLNEFIAAVNRNQAKIPRKALIITFDDGHIGNYQLLPITKELDIPVTIFLCASIINTTRKYWFNLPPHLLGEPKSKLKKIPNKERLGILKERGFTQEKEYQYPEALQETHIEEMKGAINFQSHTLFHPILPNCSYKEAKEEIFKSKEILESEFGLEINTISYPNGDYSERDVTLAKQAGYTCGITVDHGFNTIDSDLFHLKRLSVNDSDNLDEIVVKASGFWAFMKSVLMFNK